LCHNAWQPFVFACVWWAYGFCAMRLSKSIARPLRVVDISRVVRPFRLVSLANYFTLVVCIWGPAATAETPFTSHMNFVTVVVSVIAIGVFGYAGWVAWHNVGVVNSVLNPHTNRAMWLLGGLMTLVALAQVSIPRQSRGLYEGV